MRSDIHVNTYGLMYYQTGSLVAVLELGSVATNIGAPFLLKGTSLIRIRVSASCTKKNVLLICRHLTNEDIFTCAKDACIKLFTLHHRLKCN